MKVYSFFFNLDKVVAFDKPYGLSYSGGPTHRPQFDRLIQEIKVICLPFKENSIVIFVSILGLFVLTISDLFMATGFICSIFEIIRCSFLRYVFIKMI